MASDWQQVHINYQEVILYCEGHEAMAQVAQRTCGRPIHGSVKGQAGCVSEKLSLVENFPADRRG